MTKYKDITIRRGEEEDILQIYELIEQQAEHHHISLKEVKNTVEQMKKDAFGEHKFFGFLVAEAESKVLGTAIYYYTYSTWKGKSIYLEDLIVREGIRGLGIGQKLFEALIKEAERLNVAKLSWQVAEDNEGAVRFYERFDAGFDEDWINCTLSKERIHKITRAIQKRELIET